ARRHRARRAAGQAGPAARPVLPVGELRRGSLRPPGAVRHPPRPQPARRPRRGRRPPPPRGPPPPTPTRADLPPPPPPPPPPGRPARGRPARARTPPQTPRGPATGADRLPDDAVVDEQVASRRGRAPDRFEPDRWQTFE